jgi:pyrroline-5-carboxylate reductase
LASLHGRPNTIATGTLGTAIATGILDPIAKSDITIKQLIATVATKSSQSRVEDALSNHSTRLSVLGKHDNLQAIREADVVLFSIKPSKRAEVIGVPGMREALRDKLVISIMAGISTQELRNLVIGKEDHESFQVVRAMPNMAATIREATTLYTTTKFEDLSNENHSIVSWIFRQVGQAQFIAESSFDISAVLVGCAGSLLLLAVDGLLDAAVAEGVKRSEAQEMVMSSALGMMKLVPAGNHPSVLREKIASPGGCSIRALLELEKRGVRSAFTDAIMSAAERSRQMSQS